VNFEASLKLIAQLNGSMMGRDVDFEVVATAQPVHRSNVRVLADGQRTAARPRSDAKQDVKVNTAHAPPLRDTRARRGTTSPFRGVVGAHVGPSHGHALRGNAPGAASNDLQGTTRDAAVDRIKMDHSNVNRDASSSVAKPVGAGSGPAEMDAINAMLQRRACSSVPATSTSAPASANAGRALASTAAAASARSSTSSSTSASSHARRASAPEHVPPPKLGSSTHRARPQPHVPPYSRRRRDAGKLDLGLTVSGSHVSLAEEAHETGLYPVGVSERVCQLDSMSLKDLAQTQLSPEPSGSLLNAARSSITSLSSSVRSLSSTQRLSYGGQLAVDQMSAGGGVGSGVLGPASSVPPSTSNVPPRASSSTPACGGASVLQEEEDGCQLGLGRAPFETSQNPAPAAGRPKSAGSHDVRAGGARRMAVKPKDPVSRVVPCNTRNGDAPAPCKPTVGVEATCRGLPAKPTVNLLDQHELGAFGAWEGADLSMSIDTLSGYMEGAANTAHSPASDVACTLVASTDEA